MTNTSLPSESIWKLKYFFIAAGMLAVAEDVLLLVNHLESDDWIGVAGGMGYGIVSVIIGVILSEHAPRSLQKFGPRMSRRPYWLRYFAVHIPLGLVTWLSLVLMEICSVPAKGSESVSLIGGTACEYVCPWGVRTGLLVLTVSAMCYLVPYTLRRYHDSGRSTFWIVFYVLSELPLFFFAFEMGGLCVVSYVVACVFGIVHFVFCCLDGTAGDNRYGPDPKGRVGNTNVKIEDRLAQLETLKVQGLIDESEYNDKRKAILNKI